MVSVKMILFLFFFFLLQTVTSQQLPKNIFILAGQSNMAGRGGVVNDAKAGQTTWDGEVPPQSQPNPSILRLNADLSWVLAREPLHFDIDYNKTNGIGPGMPFANALLTMDPSFGVVGLVPCAVGGTRISQWAKGGFLFEQLVTRSRAAVQSGGAIRAMLWYQGESDTIESKDAHEYKGRLEKFFTDFRSDLSFPTLPIIQVALASGQGPYLETVKEAQLGVDLPNVECVDAKGLPLEPDRLHLSTVAQVQLGQMLADTYLHSPATPIPTSSNSAIKSSRLMPDLFFTLLFLSPLMLGPFV